MISGVFVYLIFTDTNSKFAQYTREEMDEIKEALLGFYRDCDQFPIGLADLETLPDETHFSGPASYRRSKWNGPYIQDKFDDDGYTRDAWNTSYVYSYTSGNTCSLTSYGANRTDDSGSGDDIVYTITAVEIEEEKKKNVQDELDIIQEALTDYFRATGENPSSIDDLFEWEVLNLHMDESSWTGASNEVEDVSGMGNHGTAYGGATTTTGKVGNAGNFDGVDDYVNFNPFGPGATPNAFSCAFWMYSEISPGTISHCFIMKPVGGTVKNRWEIAFHNGKTINLYLHNGAATSSVSATITNPQNNWHHVVVVFEPDVKEEIYIDGVLANSETPAFSGGIGDSDRYFKMGDRGWWTSDNIYYDGFLDEVRIYKVALSEDEIRRHYENPGYPRSYFDLHDYTYKYDEWETEYKFRTATVSGTTYRFFYSCGPDREDDSGKDDDILPRGLEWLQSSL